MCKINRQCWRARRERRRRYDIAGWAGLTTIDKNIGRGCAGLPKLDEAVNRRMVLVQQKGRPKRLM